MKLRPVLNYENPPTGPLVNALMHFEARCQMRGILVVDESDVRRFLTDEYPDVAELFEANHLRPA